jgi:hypothetical protein
MQTYFEVGSFLIGIMSPFEFFFNAYHYKIKSVLSKPAQKVYKFFSLPSSKNLTITM